MNNIIAIARNELKQQLKRKATYIFFVIITLLIVQDVCPLMYSSENPILNTVDFTVYQRLTFRVADGVNLYYYAVIVILVSSRILHDRSNECLDIIMSLPVSKAQYIVGKMVGNFILFSALSLFTMLIALATNAIFSSLAIEPFYIIFYYVVYIELAIIFLIITSTTISIITKNYKVSIFICLAYFAFSVVSGSLIKSATYFTIFGGKYFQMLRNLGANKDGAITAGLINLSFIVGIVVIFLVVLLSFSIKNGERKI